MFLLLSTATSTLGKSPVWRVLCFAAPVLIFLFLLVRYAQNIPATDDFGATLEFVYNFFLTDLTPGQRGQALIAQHNEHRILVSRLLALTLYKLTGEVDLAHFLYVDVLFLIGLLAVLTAIYRSVKPVPPWYHYLIPFLFLLSPHSYETFLFISGGSQSYPVLFFTSASIWLLSKAASPSRHAVGFFCLSLVAAWLATFSFGSGFLVWLGGSVFLFYQRQWPRLVTWVVLGMVAVGCYFFNFYRPTDKLALTNPFGPQLLAFLKGILLFPGAAFMIHWPDFRAVQLQVIGCYLIGLLSWGYIIYLLLTGYYRRNPLLFALLTVSLATGALLAVSRIGVGSGFLFTSRYVVFTSFTPIVLYAIALDNQVRLLRTKIWPVSLLFGMFVSLLWTNLPFIEQIYVDRQAGFSEWQRTGKPTLYIQADKQTDAGRVTKQCIAKRVFRPEKE